MRETLRIGLDCLLVGLAAGTALMMLLVALDAGGLQALVAAGGMRLVPVLMIAVFAGVAIGSVRFIVLLVLTELRDDAEDALRRRFLIPAQRRRR